MVNLSSAISALSGFELQRITRSGGTYIISLKESYHAINSIGEWSNKPFDECTWELYQDSNPTNTVDEFRLAHQWCSELKLIQHTGNGNSITLTLSDNTFWIDRFDIVVLSTKQSVSKSHLRIDYQRCVTCNLKTKSQYSVDRLSDALAEAVSLSEEIDKIIDNPDKATYMQGVDTLVSGSRWFDVNALDMY